MTRRRVEIDQTSAPNTRVGMEEVLTTGQDQCTKLYDVPIPDPKLFRRWALDTGVTACSDQRIAITSTSVGSRPWESLKY